MDDSTNTVTGQRRGSSAIPSRRPSRRDSVPVPEDDDPDDDGGGDDGDDDGGNNADGNRRKTPRLTHAVYIAKLANMFKKYGELKAADADRLTLDDVVHSIMDLATAYSTARRNAFMAAHEQMQQQRQPDTVDGVDPQQARATAETQRMIRRAIRKLNANDIRGAIAALSQSPIVSLDSVERIQELQRLYGAEPAPEPAQVVDNIRETQHVQDDDGDADDADTYEPASATACLLQGDAASDAAFHVDNSAMMATLESRKTGAGAGFSGLSYDAIKAAVKRDPQPVLTGLTAVINDVGSGRIVQDRLVKRLRTLRGIPLLKPNGGIRPIGICEALLQLAGCAAWRAQKTAAADVTGPTALGFGVKYGLEAAVFLVNGFLETNAGTVLISVDMRNAFNTLSRGAVFEGVGPIPELHAYTTVRNSGISDIAYKDNTGKDQFISVTTGVIQGDSGGSGTFNLAFRHPVAAVNNYLRFHGGLMVSIHDDGSILGKPAHAFAALAMLQREAAKIGLHVQPSKSAVYAPSGVTDHIRTLAAEAGIPIVDGLCIAGAPIGTDEYVSSNLLSIVDECSTVLTKIQAVHNDGAARGVHVTQPVMRLLQLCITQRVNHLTRMVKPDLMLPHAQRLDMLLASTVAHVLRLHSVGIEMWDLPLAGDALRVFQRLFLPCDLGGCGFQSAANACRYSYVAAAAAAAPAIKAVYTLLEVDAANDVNAVVVIHADDDDAHDADVPADNGAGVAIPIDNGAGVALPPPAAAPMAAIPAPVPAPAPAEDRAEALPPPALPSSVLATVQSLQQYNFLPQDKLTELLDSAALFNGDIADSLRQTLVRADAEHRSRLVLHSMSGSAARAFRSCMSSISAAWTQTTGSFRPLALTNQETCDAYRMRLGAPVSLPVRAREDGDSTRCRLCNHWFLTAEINEHAMCCMSGPAKGMRNTRHAKLVTAFAMVCGMASAMVAFTRHSVVGNMHDVRPGVHLDRGKYGDGTITYASDPGKPVTIDTVIVYPRADIRAAQTATGAAALAAERKKVKLYTDKYHMSEGDVIPLAAEVYGTLGEVFQTTLKDLARRSAASARRKLASTGFKGKLTAVLGASEATRLTWMHQRVSVALQRGVAAAAAHFRAEGA